MDIRFYTEREYVTMYMKLELAMVQFELFHEGWNYFLCGIVNVQSVLSKFFR